MKLSPKQSFYVLSSVLALALIGTWYIMYWSNSQLESRAAQINEKQVESLKLDDKTDEARRLRIELDELSDIILVSSEILPDAKSQENIVGELLSLASARSIVLESISFGGAESSPAAAAGSETSQAIAVKEVPGTFSLSIKTSIESDYENILQFLEDIENNKRQFEVTDITIAPIPEKQNVFNAQLTLVTYIQP